MPRATPAHRLRHILEEVEAVAAYVSGRDEADLRRDRMLRDAVERCLERISEASRNLPPEMKSRFPDIPWRDIASLGNVLRHGYDGVELTEIWRIATSDITTLRAVIETLMRQQGD